MSIPGYVTINITRNTVGIARQGFGVPMLLSAYASFPERVRYYTDLAGVAADFAVTSSPEYVFAQQVFAQSPKVTQLAIGRSANKPTLVYQVSVASVRNSYTYTLRVRGKGVTSTDVTFTSDGSATDGEIASGLVTALNAVVGKNYTATGSTSPISITGTAPGDWFTVEVVNPADLSVAATHVDPGVAADLDAILLESRAWYALYTVYNSNAYALAAAAWTESNKRVYMMDVNETAAITTAVGNSDTLDDIHTLSYLRTMGNYHSRPSEMLGAALLGKILPFDPGGETAAAKTLAGVSANTLTTTHRNNLTNRKANSYEQPVPGLSLTFDGTVASGDYLDVTRGLDWLDDDMGKGVLEVLASNPKIAFDDAGIELVASRVRASLSRAQTRQIINAGWTVTVPRASAVPTSDKAARRLTGLKFDGVLTGAVHSAVINGSVSL